MKIKTYYKNDGNGAKIIAKTTYKGKRRQLSIDYPHHLHGEEKHKLAAERLHTKLVEKSTEFESECVGQKNCTYIFTAKG